MSKLFKIFLLVALVVAWTAPSWGAAAPKYMRGERMRVDARDFQPPPGTQNWGQSRRLGTASAAATPAPHAVAFGSTYYDYQHNGSTGRQADKGVDGSGNNYVQISWMKAPGPSLSDRTVEWNRAPIQGPVAPVALGNGGSISAVLIGAPLTLSQTFTAVRPGYTNTRNRPNGGNVTIYHDAPETGGVQFWEAQLDLLPTQGFFSSAVSTSPNPPGSQYQGDAVIWPKAAISECAGGTQLIHHGIGTWSGASNQTWYWRGVIDENGSADSISWNTVNYPKIIDSVSVGISNVVEANGDTVAIILGSQVNTTNADVVLYQSTDCGVTWPTTPINITNYSSADAEGFWIETDAVYDVDGNLHVLWNTAPADGQDYPVNLYHWDQLSNQVRLVTSASWINTCVNGTITNIGSNNGSGTNNLAIADINMSLKPAGVYSADELLYAVWTQYGPTDNDCATVDAVGTLGGHVNGEIYMSVSSNDGLTWDRPQNVTGTVTPDCLPGDCNSESWTTTAARADSGVYISFVDDAHAGPIVFGGGAWVDNNYSVIAPEARLPVLEPVIAVTPTNFIELNANPITGALETVNLNVISVGNADLTWTVDVMPDNAGQTYVNVNGGLTTNGAISAGGPPSVVTVGYSASGLADPSEHAWRLEVTSNDPTNDPGQGGSPIDVNLQVFAASVWKTCVEDSLSTGLHRMQISACLEMGDQGTAGTGFFDYATTAEWMFSGSPVVTLNDGSQNLAYHNAFMGLADRTRLQNKSFRAQSDMTVARGQGFTVGDSSWIGDKATGNASSTDTTIGIDYEMIFPQEPHLARGCVFTFAMASLTGAPIIGVSYGVVADLDTDPSAGDNAGAGNPGAGWIGAVGGESDDDANFTPNDSIMALFHVPQGTSCQRSGAVAAQVLANPNYVHAANEYEVDSLYALFTGFGALGTWGTNIHIDTGQQFDDVSVMLVSGYNETIDNVALTRWGYGVAVTDLGEADLETTIEALRAATVAACQISCLIVVNGDVNVSGSVTSADIIYLVNFVFKGQAAPLPCDANGDVNCSGSVTSADIIYLVNFVFKGQAAPCDICALSPIGGTCN